MDALLLEVEIQKKYLANEKIETIYFGGGTPSLASSYDLNRIVNSIDRYFSITRNPEITLEANPDDLTPEKLSEFKTLGINRLSIGIQTWDDSILKFINRAHSSSQSRIALEHTKKIGFENISLDLIFGIPGQTLEMVRKDVETMLAYSPKHISTYSLTVEGKTAFYNWKQKGKFQEIPDDQIAEQYHLIMNTLNDAGYDHYEISNFAKPGYASIHNTNYWKGIKYLGIGPSAHSYDGASRQHNVSNNSRYLKSINSGKIPFEKEVLSRKDQINEFIFTSLRTRWGCDVTELKNRFNFDLLKSNETYIQQLKRQNLLAIDGDILRLTNNGKLLADKIISDLFVVE